VGRLRGVVRLASVGLHIPRQGGRGFLGKAATDS
jgi:hypothetical protein